MRQGKLLNLQVLQMVAEVKLFETCCKVCMTCRIEAYKWACSRLKELQGSHGCRSEAGNQVLVHEKPVQCKYLQAAPC